MTKIVRHNYFGRTLEGSHLSWLSTTLVAGSFLIEEFGPPTTLVQVASSHESSEAVVAHEDFENSNHVILKTQEKRR